MKKILLILTLLCGTLSVYASKETDLVNSLYEYQSKGGKYYDSKIQLLQMLVGDTITFNFNDTESTTLFSLSTPDTIWIKNRPKKNPKEGIHYIINYAYKWATNEAGEFYTPTSEIENKQFKVIRVLGYHPHEKLYNPCLYNPYISYRKEYAIQLVEVNNTDVVNFAIPSSKVDYNISITSSKVNNIINSLIDKVFYIKTSGYFLKKTYIKTALKKGNFNILLELGELKNFTPQLNLEFISEDGTNIPYEPVEKKYRQNDELISESEYFNYIKKITPKLINSVIDDSVLNSAIELPFNFEFIKGKVSGYNSRISQEIDPTADYDGLKGDKLLPLNSNVLIAEKFSFNSNSFYTAIFNGKAFFINANNVTLTDDMNYRLDSLSLCEKNQKDYFFYKSLILSKRNYLSEINDLHKELSSYAKYGLAITDWGIYDESVYTEGTSISFDFYNPTLKRIKYVTVNFVGYNAVEDPVSTRGSYTVTRKCIGPIEPEGMASYVFDYVWFTDIVEYAKIKSIVVQYFDGTSKTITDYKKIKFSQELNNYISTTNPVADFD